MTAATRVFGDRQAGKTEMLLAFAEKLCREGQKVLYVSNGHATARNDFMRVRQSVGSVDGFSSYCANGAERIVHESGGELKFISAGAATPRGWLADTMFLDDVRMDYGFDYPVERVVRASL